MELLYPAAVVALKTLFRLQGLRFSVSGVEHVPREGGAVMAINHIGYFDFTYAGYAAEKAGRHVRFMAKKELFDHRVAGPFLRGMRHISVDRSAGGQAYRDALTYLKNGEVVGVFPEGTISMSFELKELKNGAVRMAAATGVPLLPAIVWGSQRVWTKGRKPHLARPRAAITVSIGEPLHLTRRDDPELALATLRERMEGLLHEAQESYLDAPSGPTDAWWLPARLGGTAPTPEEAHLAEVKIRAEQRERRR
jgi:1-acyl-sn-glycerol-3-phosphate acyltransferase